MTSGSHTSVLQAGAPAAEAALAVVLLHGRGGSAQDILGLAEAFALPQVAYFAPQAAGHSWYPQSFLAPLEANEPWLGSALGGIEALVASLQTAGFARERIVLGGFSQGACVATQFVATRPARYGGLIAYTGGLIGPRGASLAGDGIATRPLARMPALLASGDPDPHVPWSRVAESAARLEALGAVVTLDRHPGRPHTVSAQEIEAGRKLLTEALASAPDLAR